MQHAMWPRNVSVYACRNPPCFSTYACLTHLIQLLAQEGMLRGRHALSCIPPNPEWACKYLDPKYVADYAG